MSSFFPPVKIVFYNAVEQPNCCITPSDEKMKGKKVLSNHFPGGRRLPSYSFSTACAPHELVAVHNATALVFMQDALHEIRPRRSTPIGRYDKPWSLLSHWLYDCR
ncbi:hypothetical protein VFPFJ_11762 [Purpureocillium lilacinum]|uniref:Uncharacterized protein n=1 Tax=Purpureocillium lilacinum TaxID=33203 RepID=A0A179EVV7_PURLI|nr:hypothetical protein VFPFJ_11762 [Purpureocillium lilacinum]OAQ57308.1 hypothetical protein VFPFJ_11762 [Purpureocillium lilacinum]